MNSTLPPALYTLNDASKLIGCTRTHVYKIVRRGDLEVERDEAGRLRVSPFEIYRYLREQD